MCKALPERDGRMDGLIDELKNRHLVAEYETEDQCRSLNFSQMLCEGEFLA